MTGRSGRAVIGIAGLATMLAAASGCASLQANGPVTAVTQGDTGSSQVQIWPSPPTANESPSAIVTGFLEAARSGSANLAIADAYLTSDMQQEWKSDQNTVIVLADDSESYPQPAGQDNASQSYNNGGQNTSAQGIPEAGQKLARDAGAASGSGYAGLIEQVQGDLIGTVDSSGLYSASSSPETYEFGLTATKSGYRISSLPPDFGVLMERSDFESSFDRHDVYYTNAQYGGKLIPTQVYLPAQDTDQELASAMARLTVQGAPDALGSATQVAVQGATFKGITFDGNGSATVTINSHGACAKSVSTCPSLGDQLVTTLNNLSTKVTEVTVVDQANNQSYQPAYEQSSLNSYGLSQSARGGQQFYAIADDGAVEQVTTFGSVSAAEAAYGPPKSKYRQVAVEPSQQGGHDQQIALVSQDGTKIYVPHRQGGSYQLTQVYPSGSSQAAGTVGTPSWDAFGTLWFTVTQGGGTSVYRYAQDTLSQVAVGGLPGRITQIAAAPDGARVAVAYKDATGDSWISIAAVSQGDGGWQLALDKPEVAAADWSQINAFDWYSEDSLAVMGIQPNSQVLGLYQIYADGSAVYDSLTQQPVEAGPPANAQGFVWTIGGQPIAAAANNGKNLLYQLSVEGQDAQLLAGVSGTSPSY